MPDDPTPEDLRAREMEETTKEHEAVAPGEAQAAHRRADKAGYLADKLEQQRESNAGR